MNKKYTLPKIKKKRKISLKRFEALAKKVRRYFQEEEKYIESCQKENVYSQTTRFSFSP